MKTNIKMKEKALMEEAISEVDHLFKPKVRDVKKCVEDLIRKKYMRRDDKDPETLHYLD